MLVHLAIIFVGGSAVAEKSIDVMVQNSIKTLTSHSQITSILDNQNELTRLAAMAPFTGRDAAIVFKKPKKENELLSWAKDNKVNIISLEAKFFIGNLVFKAQFYDLNSLEGTLKEQLGYLKERHISSVRNIIREKEIKLGSKKLSSESRKASIKALANYQKLLKKPLEYIQTGIVATHDDLKTMRGHSDTAILLIQEDKTQQRERSQAVAKRPLKNKSPLIQKINTANMREQSNDSLPGPYLAKNMAVLVITPSICGGSSAPEFNCPGDRYWLPLKSNTAMSVLIKVYGGENPFMEGYFYSTFKWSETRDQGQSIPYNTLAYKATGTAHCNPEIIGNLTAPCGGNTAQKDVTYVPESTYEHEGIIENWSCHLAPRTGTHLDRYYNCLTTEYALSVLPDWYVDTTLLDNWMDYSATMGSLSPDRIVEGREYYTYVYFWAWGNEDFTGRQVTMSGQIGSEYALPVPPSLRVFAVDSTKIDTNILIPIPVRSTLK